MLCVGLTYLQMAGLLRRETDVVNMAVGSVHSAPSTCSARVMYRGPGACVHMCRTQGM